MATRGTATRRSTRSTSGRSYDNVVCFLCNKGDNDKKLLLCDGCDAGFHTYCLNLGGVPDGNWYCPRCAMERMNMMEDDMQDAEPAAPAEPEPIRDVVLYERVSSKGQNDPEHGRVGQHTQNHTLLEFCLHNGLTVMHTFRDVGTGRNVEDLDQLHAAIKKLQPGMALLVYSVSRIGRNAVSVQGVIDEVHRRGARVYSVSDAQFSENPDGSMNDAFVDLMRQAQQESERLSQVVRQSIARRRQQGAHFGPAPYGTEVYHDDAGVRRLRDRADEQPLANEIKQWQRDGQAWNRMLTTLRDRGLEYSHRGQRWTVTKLKRCCGEMPVRHQPQQQVFRGGFW